MRALLGLGDLHRCHLPLGLSLSVGNLLGCLLSGPGDVDCDLPDSVRPLRTSGLGRAVAEQLREELASVRTKHRAELERARADRNDRDQLRVDTTARLDELRAARAAAEQRAADGHAAAEQLREELASVRTEHRAELERLRTTRLGELHAAHRAQLEAADRTRSEPRADGPGRLGRDEQL